MNWQEKIRLFQENIFKTLNITFITVVASPYYFIYYNTLFYDAT